MTFRPSMELAGLLDPPGAEAQAPIDDNQFCAAAPANGVTVKLQASGSLTAEAWEQLMTSLEALRPSFVISQGVQ